MYNLTQSEMSKADIWKEQRQSHKGRTGLQPETIDS